MASSPGRPTGMASAAWFLVLLVSGCTIVRPIRTVDMLTPVDEGLAGARTKTAVVEVFDGTSNPVWGAYAARVLSDDLSSRGAFSRVSVSTTSGPDADYVVKGALEHLFYGGTEDATRVSVRVRVVDASGRVRFEKVVKASMEEAAFHVTWLRRVDPPSPAVEEVLTRVLGQIARDIAVRTASPAGQNP